MSGEDSDDAHSCRPGGFHSGIRILEDDAMGGRRAQQAGGAQINLRVGFGVVDLVSVHHHGEVTQQAGALQEELDVGGLGVAGDSLGRGGMPSRNPRRPGTSRLSMRPSIIWR